MRSSTLSLRLLLRHQLEIAADRAQRRNAITGRPSLSPSRLSGRWPAGCRGLLPVLIALSAQMPSTVCHAPPEATAGTINRRRVAGRGWLDHAGARNRRYAETLARLRTPRTAVVYVRRRDVERVSSSSAQAERAASMELAQEPPPQADVAASLPSRRDADAGAGKMNKCVFRIANEVTIDQAAAPPAAGRQHRAAPATHPRERSTSRRTQPALRTASTLRERGAPGDRA